jgi:hypothetical protein
MKAIFGIALLAALVTVVAWERSSIGRLRAANESLRAQKIEAERLEAENRDLPKFRGDAGTDPLAVEAGPVTELLRLRAEVSRLRGQPQEAARLRAENERIATEIKSGKFAPKRLADMEGFIRREKCTNAGFATPEAAAQSYFIALVSGDVEQFVRCLTPEDAEQMRRQIEENPERFGNEFQKGMAQIFGKAAGLRIAGRRDVSDETITLELQFAAEGGVMPVPLRRIGNEWKLDHSAGAELRSR